MTEKTDEKILTENLISAFSAGGRLLKSYRDTEQIFPMTVDRLNAISDSDEVRIDALLYRFGSTLSIIQDHVFRTIAVLEGEDVSVRSKRDIGNLMEKFGAISDVSEFASFARLRNKLFHAYPDNKEKQVEIINSVHSECKGLLASLVMISDYVSKKELIANPPKFEPEYVFNPFWDAEIQEKESDNDRDFNTKNKDI